MLQKWNLSILVEVYDTPEQIIFSESSVFFLQELFSEILFESV